MGQDDWYRNTEWNAEIEAAFHARLALSRSGRAQQLRIQAGYLAMRYPIAALGLIEKFFETENESEVSMAYCEQAEAYLALGRIDDAVAAYKRAVEWEEVHPKYISPAQLELPKLVVLHGIASEYDYVVELVNRRGGDEVNLMFPSNVYLWNGCLAIIADERGQIGVARDFARGALEAASVEESPFRYHRKVGVVQDTSDDFGRRVENLARGLDRGPR